MIIRKLFFTLFIEIIRVIITSGFAASFLKCTDNRFKRLIAYVFSVSVTTLAYAIFGNPILNLISTLLGLVVISLVYEGTMRARLLFVFFVLAISCVIDLSVYAILNKIHDYVSYVSYANILSLLFLLSAQLITKRLFGKSKDDLSDRHWKLYISSLSVCIITSLIIAVDMSISPLSLSIVCGAFLVVNIIIAYLIDDLVKTSKDAIENQILKDQMESYEREIKLQNEKVDVLRSLKHDMKRHFSEIRTLAERGETDQIEKYMSELTENLIGPGLLVDSGNVGVDIVLNYMLRKAVEKKIRLNVRVTIPKELNLSTYDMNIILGNLIENAIEAQEFVINPRLDVTIGFMKDSLTIEISNPYSEKIELKNGLPVTTKKPHDEHGYGLRNVKMVLEKYTSSIDFEYLEGWFTVKILMKVL